MDRGNRYLIGVREDLPSSSAFSEGSKNSHEKYQIALMNLQNNVSLQEDGTSSVICVVCAFHQNVCNKVLFCDKPGPFVFIIISYLFA